MSKALDTVRRAELFKILKEILKEDEIHMMKILEENEEVDKNQNNKGQKEKKIGEVVEKVALWRKFYTGFYD